MRTRRYKLWIENVNCEFWCMLFDSEKRLHKYVERKTESEAPVDVGAGCALCNKGKREIIICLCVNDINHFVIGHEALHAALWYAKINRRKYTQKKWCNILTGWDNEPIEEEVADVCGAVISSIWSVFTKHFSIVESNT